MNVRLIAKRLTIGFQTHSRRRIVNCTVIHNKHRMQRKQELFVVVAMDSLPHNEIKSVTGPNGNFWTFDVSSSAMSSKLESFDSLSRPGFFYSMKT